ncbi:hypothetical protein [Actinomycetospora sp. TBRC 11914]|uniref:hypothetical protein n=1 Tax=Actinomycetospora sp. TBRC 11914 TaxID=2729387 RepID=UPI00145C8C63|nr:hypothetical protein [Actinomycetospora sp. TBRC 11914]NMO88511.1 hypothetical protein [Actinomycetospora sp. TBRC 11914]
MTVYVSLPQFPLTLKYEEPLEEVARHLQGLVEEAKVHRLQVNDESIILVNFGVIESITLTEGARTLELEELNRGLSTSTQTTSR